MKHHETPTLWITADDGQSVSFHGLLDRLGQFGGLGPGLVHGHAGRDAGAGVLGRGEPGVAQELGALLDELEESGGVLEFGQGGLGRVGAFHRLDTQSR